MSLKKMFATMKNEGLLVSAIDKFLLTIGQDEDRKHGWNSPSGVSTCPLSQYWTRKGEKRDGFIDPRTRRIFNNGDHTHDRLQEYLEKAGVLLMREVPVWDCELFVLGHTDGLLKYGKGLAVLEIKSINSNGFSKLIGAKDDHKEQAQVYMTSLEKLRKEIHKKCKTKLLFLKYRGKLLKKFKALLETFVTSGKKFSKEEKISFQLDNMKRALDLLWECKIPIDTSIFLYENKDTQELKEYAVKCDEELVKEIAGRLEFVNEKVEANEEPSRPASATSKSCGMCRWCNFTVKCWH